MPGWAPRGMQMHGGGPQHFCRQQRCGMLAGNGWSEVEASLVPRA